MSANWTGPIDAPFTIDLDSTICETYGPAKEGARHHGYTGARGYHPLLAIAAGTGDVLMSRLREGLANTTRGAAHFLRETVSLVRYAGASGQLTVRAIEAGNPGRDKMRDNKEKLHRNRTGRGAANAVADSPDYTAEERQTVRQGLRLLARIIARAHLRRQAARWEVMQEATNGECPLAAPHGPPARMRGSGVSNLWNGR